VSINDPWRVGHYDKRGSYILLRGIETCYDADRCLREWDSEEEAKAWAEANLRPPFAWRPTGQLKLGGMVE
jgi:hypothetical protein